MIDLRDGRLHDITGHIKVTLVPVFEQTIASVLGGVGRLQRGPIARARQRLSEVIAPPIQTGRSFTVVVTPKGKVGVR